MRVFAFLFMLFSVNASHLITSDDIDTLLSKFMLNKETTEENQILKDAFRILHRTERVSTRSVENTSQEMSLLCLACRSGVGVFIRNIRKGQSDKDAEEVLIKLCAGIGIESYNVCRGVVMLNVPILSHIIRNVPEATATAFCGLVLQSATNRRICPIDDARFEWKVQLPEKRVSTTRRRNNFKAKDLKVAIITDAHIDPLYEAFGVANCDAPTCCRKGQKPRSSLYSPHVDESVLERSLVYDNGELKLNMTASSQNSKASREMYQRQEAAAPAGYWGDYRNCDTPVWAFDDAIERIHEDHKDVDVIYYMGDSIDHGVWETSYELINSVNRYFIQKIRATFGDHVVVVPTIGNHESQPTNQFAPSYVVGEHLNTTWLYKALADKWDFYLTKDAKKTLREHGDFSMPVRPGLRVISLNNNVAYRYNWWVVYDPLDAKRHLDWLIQELYKAELAEEKVHILTHIPPGVHDLTHTWTREYNRIVNRFSATIAAEFNGHTHSDEFRVFYNPEGDPINVAWGGGAVTAYTFYNLNYKIATFDSNTHNPTRIANYAYNLTEANLTPNRRPHWFMLYDMQNSFRLDDLTANSMNKLVYSMATNKRRLLDMYAAFNSKISDVRWPACDDNCKLDTLCQTVVTVLWERQRCDELRRLYYLQQ